MQKETKEFIKNGRVCYRRECNGCTGCWCDEDNPPQGEEG